MALTCAKRPRVILVSSDTLAGSTREDRRTLWWSPVRAQTGLLVPEVNRRARIKTLLDADEVMR